MKSVKFPKALKQVCFSKIKKDKKYFVTVQAIGEDDIDADITQTYLMDGDRIIKLAKQGDMIAYSFDDWKNDEGESSKKTFFTVAEKNFLKALDEINDNDLFYHFFEC